MNAFRADLHCHSIYSDGSDTPATLLTMAKRLGLQGLSITDHDSIDAYTPELFTLADELNVRLLPGVEISSELKESSVHILAYGKEIISGALCSFLEEMQKRRRARNLAILEKLSAKNMPISEEELMAYAVQRTIGRPHIAELMVQKGYVSCLYEAFDKYLKEGRPCYASGIKYTPTEVIEVIHQAKGRAVLAHPHFLKSSLANRLLSLPFDGIECYYGNLAKSFEVPWVKLAKKRNLIATGGSDYHGAIKPHIALGCSTVDESTFNQLIS